VLHVNQQIVHGAKLCSKATELGCDTSEKLEATLVELILKLVEILTNAVLLRNSAFSFKGMAPPAVKMALYKKKLRLHQEAVVQACALPDVDALVGKTSTSGDRLSAGILKSGR
jgi:hypothetical protein